MYYIRLHLCLKQDYTWPYLKCRPLPCPRYYIKIYS